MRSKTPSQALRHGCHLIWELAARHRTANPWVSGSALTRVDSVDSDLDVLVDPLPETTLFDLGGLQEALGVRVDVKTPMDLPPNIRANVLQQAVPV